MKQYVIKGAAALLLAIATIPATAQNDTENKGEQQVIVITRKGKVNEKLLVELSADGKVLINGKEKVDDVTVNISKIKDGSHFYGSVGGNKAWSFNIDENRRSLFAEDSNRAMLGITTDIDDRGAEVVTVNKESAAEKAGLKKGDIITHIGNKKIEDADDVTEAVRSRKPGDQVAINILRNGKEQKLTAKLDKYKGVFMGEFSPGRVFGDIRPAIPNVPSVQLRGMINSGRPKLGLSIQDTDDGKGVKVLGVTNDGNAAKAGIKEGDIITHVDDKAVNTTDEITRLLRDGRDKTSMGMKVIRNGKAQNLEVKLPRTLKKADL